MRKILLTVALAALPGFAHATCGDDVESISKQYHVASALPSASQGTTSDKLAASGGVIAPPSTGDLAGAARPVPGGDRLTGDRMQTAPAIAPQTADGGMEKSAPDATASQAALITQGSSLLQAAREAAKNGNEAACRQRLADAVKLLSNTPSRE